jgi:phytanoyl-CoA hydroxylase
MQPGKLRRKFGLENENKDYCRRMLDAHSEKWYRDFCEHPALKEFVLRLSGWDDATLLLRSILRPNVPSSETTQVHYDQIFLRAGPDTSLTAWVPIGDCSIQGGGLLYLEDSVPIGKQLEKEFNAAASKLSDAERISAFNSTMMDTGYLEKDSGKFSKAWGKRWLGANYEAGDVVIHDPYMIHSSAMNEDPKGAIRVATDLRFVESGKPYDQRWMKIWTVSRFLCSRYSVLTTFSIAR